MADKCPNCELIDKEMKLKAERALYELYKPEAQREVDRLIAKIAQLESALRDAEKREKDNYRLYTDALRNARKHVDFIEALEKLMRKELGQWRL